MSSPSPTSYLPANVGQFEWLVILGGFACFAMAWGIGANDVANCFGTSVGAKAITLKQAIIIAAVFEFIGALVLGAGVTSTVRSGITDFDYFEGEEDLLMLGMFSSLCSAALWLFFATKWCLPVSTTQAVVGSIIGFTIIEKGTNAIYWNNVYQIIIWWIATPLSAAICSVFLFIPLRHYLLRRPNDSYQMTLKYWPLFVFLVIFIMTIFLLEKGVKRIDIELDIGIVSLIALLIAIVIAVFAYFLFIKTNMVHKFVQIRCKDRLLDYEDVNSKSSEMATNTNKQKQTDPNGYGSLVEKTDKFDVENEDNRDDGGTLNENIDNMKEQLLYGMNVDILADLSRKEENIRNEQENFDPQVEESFAWLQVLTATFAILAHGSNDVANAVAPFAAMIDILQSGGVSRNVDVDWWVLALGGVAMSIGLATYGYKIIKCLGARMAAMSCTRGYCIQLSAATTIILASYYGQPASSTHAQVGATVGCGLLELMNPDSKFTITDVVNWMLLIQICCGWIMTIIISGLTSAGIFSLLAYSPAHPSVCQ